MMFCTSSNLCVNLSLNVIEKVTTVYIYKLLISAGDNLYAWSRPNASIQPPHGSHPSSSGPSFLWPSTLRPISASGFDLTQTCSRGSHFFFMAIYVTTCFLSLAIYVYRLTVVMYITTFIFVLTLCI